MSTTGDRITHRGIKVVFVDTRDISDGDLVGCPQCPFVDNENSRCEKAPCAGGYLLTVPNYVKWKLTK